jgi:hypothetical protein
MRPFALFTETRLTRALLVGRHAIMRHYGASVICCALFGWGCGPPGRVPTAPSQVPSTVVSLVQCPPCPLPGAYALSGVIKAAGIPVAGATVGLVKLGIQAPVAPGPAELIASRLTDESGSYSFPSVENVSFSGALVAVSKTGYFIDTKYIQMSQDRQLDFDLEPSVNIAVGQTVSSQVGAARCASGGYGGGGGAACQRFALPVHASGMLDVTISSSPASPFDVTVMRPNGTYGMYGSFNSSPLTVTLSVTAGLTYQIDVVHVNASTREFELRTILK